MLLWMTPPTWFSGDLEDPEVFGLLSPRKSCQLRARVRTGRLTSPCHCPTYSPALCKLFSPAQDSIWELAVSFVSKSREREIPCSPGLLFLNSQQQDLVALGNVAVTPSSPPLLLSASCQQQEQIVGITCLQTQPQIKCWYPEGPFCSLTKGKWNIFFVSHLKIQVTIGICG